MWHYKDQKRYGLVAHALACSRPFALVIGMMIFGFLSYPRPKPKRVETPPTYLTNPKTAQDFVDRAAHYMIKKERTYENVQHALADCDRAVKLKPNEAWPLICRVNPLAYLGRKDEAREVLREAIVRHRKEGKKAAAEIYEEMSFPVIDGIAPLSPSPVHSETNK